LTSDAFVCLSGIQFSLPNGQKLFDNYSLVINKPVSGVVGRNGIGKSILCRIIAGELQPERGNVQTRGSVCYVAQSWRGDAQDTIARVLGIDANLAAIARIERGSIEPVDHELAEGWWNWKPRLARFCEELQMTFVPRMDKVIADYSGGEQMLVMILAALWQQPDMLVLDEPGNHLDREQKTRLVSWIRSCNLPLIIASHDPLLLSAVDEIWELGEHDLYHHGGNYALYRQQHDQRLASQRDNFSHANALLKKERGEAQALHEKRQQRASRGKRSAVHRNLSKVEIGAAREQASSSANRDSKLKQNRIDRANSERQRQLAQLEQEDPIDLSLPETTVAKAQRVLELNALVVGYDIPLNRPLEFSVTGPGRIHLQGKNGSGKSALLKTIAGELSPLSGDVALHVTASYLDQDCSFLSPEKTALENYMALNPGLPEQSYRDRLAWVRFRGDKAHHRVSTLSGGERLKLALACVLLATNAPQMLLLDEPTNHLDHDSRLALLQALAAYEGAMIVVSHDPAFVEALDCERLVLENLD